MPTPIEPFVLPRLDWYDEKGRIYKDALIENFNAIEQKLYEIQSLDALEINIPDFTTVTYPDVTLDSDDSAIVNLKSFLEITGLVNFPIECSFKNGTCSVGWWGSDYLYHTLTVDLDMDSDTPAVFFNPSGEGSITVGKDTSIPSGSYFVGYYTNGNFIGMHEDWIYMDVDIMQALGNMSIEPQGRAFSGVNNGHENEVLIVNERTQVWSIVERHTANYPMISADIGRKTR